MNDALSAYEPVLRVDDLSVDYHVGAGTFHALSGISFDLFPGKVLGIVGETGCGKSTLAAAIPRLLPEPPAKVLHGRVAFQGQDLLQIPKWKMPNIRGTGIAMIFQEPINSLNPAYRIYDQVAEAVIIRRRREAQLPTAPPDSPGPFDYSKPSPGPKASQVLTHPFVPTVPEGAKRKATGLSTAEVEAEVIEYLKLVRITDPETILELYPHELSGGMRQRIMIAMALSQRPSLLIADEPTSALDVTIQAQVLSLMKDLMNEVHTSILFISHDLGVIAETADDVGVMYAGHLVELGPVDQIFRAPKHPYTAALLKSAPDKYKSDGPLFTIAGSVPSLADLPPGCPFAPRCPIAQPVCTVPPGPTLTGLGPSLFASEHKTGCLFPQDVVIPS